MLSPLQTTKELLTVIEQNNALLANLSTALAGKPSEPLENCRVKFASQNNGSATVAALANSQNEQMFIGKSDFQELKDLLLDKIDSQNRHFDARIRGLAHRSQGQREEIPRSWTATLFYLWTNWPSCNQVPRTQRSKPTAISSGIISRSQI